MEVMINIQEEVQKIKQDKHEKHEKHEKKANYNTHQLQFSHNL